MHGTGLNALYYISLNPHTLLSYPLSTEEELRLSNLPKVNQLVNDGAMIQTHTVDFGAGLQMFFPMLYSLLNLRLLPCQSCSHLSVICECQTPLPSFTASMTILQDRFF